MRCEYCDIIERKTKAHILYEDSEIIVAIKDLVATPGQITVFPKEHYVILEMVPEKILEKCAIIANKVSSAVFEALEAQGTNIMIQNGLDSGQKIPHFGIEIIPRRENDGLSLEWKGKNPVGDELEQLQSLLVEEMKKPKVKEDDKDLKSKNKTEKESYLIKSLRRLP